MRRLHFLQKTFILYLVLVALNLSCRKLDVVSSSKTITTEEKFFDAHRSSAKEEAVIVNFLKRTNEKSPFVKLTAQKIGFPIWDKLIMRNVKTTRVMSEGGSGQIQSMANTGSCDIYYIPFVRDSQNHVNAAMIIKAFPTDTTIGYLCDWQYKNLLARPSDSLNVKKFALIFMRFDYSVLGHKGFIITDKAIFASKNHSSADEIKLELKNEEHKTVKANSMYVTCQDYVVEFISCPYIRRDGYCAGPGGTCDRCPSCPSVTINYTECWDEWIDDEGGGSSGDGGSGGGGSVPPSDPCGGGDTPPTADAVNPGGQARVGAFSPPPTMPCNEPGWEPDPGPYTIPDEYGFYYDRILELQHVIDGNENGVLPCNTLLLFKQFSQQFFNDLTLFSAPQAVKDRIQNIINSNSNFTSSNFFLQTLNDAKGAVVNCDFFPVNITNMPTINGQQQTPEQFLEYFRFHMNDFVTPGGIVSFSPYIGQGLNETAKWNQAGENSLGTLVHIPLVSVNDGTVIESDYNISGPPTNDSYTFSTMHSPLDAYHPVSGNRRFGIYRDQAGTQVFYIAGVDRISTNSIAFGNFLGSIFQMDGFKEADKLWRDIQANMVNFINTHGGTANKFSGLSDFTARANWSDVEQFLKKQIDYAELKRRLGC